MKKKSNREKFLKHCIKKMNYLSYDELVTLYKGKCILDRIISNCLITRSKFDLEEMDVEHFINVYIALTKEISNIMIEVNIKRLTENNDEECY